MDTPKSAKVSAEGVNGGEGRKTEAAEVFSRVQGRDGAAILAQWQEHRPDSAGARDRRPTLPARCSSMLLQDRVQLRPRACSTQRLSAVPAGSDVPGTHSLARGILRLV